jgi:selenide,water dikinase
MTDVTGFGLFGHLLEVCRASGAGASIDFARIPLLPDALDLAKRGYVTGASGRNFDGYGSHVTIAPERGEIARALLTDPQTSGGLLVACEVAYADEVLDVFRSKGFENATTIGVMAKGPPHIHVS